MAGWVDLIEAPIPSQTNQVCLIVGEQSALVWDRVNAALREFEVVTRVNTDRDLSYSLTSLSMKAAYLVVDPSEELLQSVEKLLRGGCADSVFILLSKPGEDKASLNYLKTKAQQSKAYYSITTPKTESSKYKMATFFQMRWGTSREMAWEACTLLDFSPGRLYYFDIMYRVATGGELLPSSRSQEVIYSILGQDSPNTVVANILDGRPVSSHYSSDFSRQVIRTLMEVVVDAKMVRASIDRGNTNPSLVVKDTGLTQFQVIRAFQFAESLTMRGLIHRERMLTFSIQFSNQPEVLSVLTQIFKGA